MSLADVTPTVLGRIGIPIKPEARPALAGIDLFSGPVPGDRTHYFSCWYAERCQGAIRGMDKVVIRRETGESWYFDLAADPTEAHAHVVPERLRDLAAQVPKTLDPFRIAHWPVTLAATRPYGLWRCEAGRLCTHPNAREIGSAP